VRRSQFLAALAQFMEAVVIVDPAEYQRHPDEPPDPAALRTLPFGPHGQGLVTFLKALWSQFSPGG
jgi:hypothetical protein